VNTERQLGKAHLIREGDWPLLNDYLFLSYTMTSDVSQRQRLFRVVQMFGPKPVKLSALLLGKTRFGERI